MKNIFFGDNDVELSKIATSADPSAFLLTSKNYIDYVNGLDFTTAYTGLADLPKDISLVVKILDLADTITYCPPAVWSGTGIQEYTEFLLLMFNKFKNNVINLNLDNLNFSKYVSLADTRRVDGTQLWVAGCSFSHGVGITSENRYGELLSKKLNLPVSHLTQSGSSIEWAADQILRSDVRENDIVVWGLTNEYRFPYWNNKTDKAGHITQSVIDSGTNFTLDRFVAKQLICNDNHLQYQAIIHIFQVINFCKKINAKLLILGLLTSHLSVLFLNNIKEFFPYFNTSSFNHIDYGDDNLHPGIKQHQAYAEYCHQSLKKLNYI
jgi:hypothetical protein